MHVCERIKNVNKNNLQFSYCDSVKLADTNCIDRS